MQCVHDLRSLGRLVVDLLVRARSEERGEGVDDRQESLAREPGGGEVGVEHNEVGTFGDELQQFAAEGGSDVLVRHLAQACARLRLGLERDALLIERRHRLEPDVR